MQALYSVDILQDIVRYIHIRARGLGTQSSDQRQDNYFSFWVFMP
uniref:Uncharacterized protein n=1 Tax=Arundo donax TaxID=35708 RepID=A0A0A9E4T8_ARUDO